MTKKEIIIIGGGGHAKACIDILEETNVYNIKGIIDIKEKIGEYILGYQIIDDDRKVWNYDSKRTVIGELQLENSWFYPFKYSTNDSTDFIKNIFRGFENLDLIKDKV